MKPWLPIISFRHTPHSNHMPLSLITQHAAPSHLWTLAHDVPSAYIYLCLDRVRSLSSVLPWRLVLPHHPILL